MKKRRVWTIWYTSDDDWLFDKIDQARRAKAMTQKGFLLYAIANMEPDLAADIVEYLMKKKRSKNTPVIAKDLENAANTDD